MFVELISKILVYSPRDRLKPLEVLLHPFFNDLREEKFEMANVTLPDFFDFSKEELSIQPEIANKLTPAWYSKKK
jgi:glycogen synthase kinase 3 beta